MRLQTIGVCDACQGWVLALVHYSSVNLLNLWDPVDFQLKIHEHVSVCQVPHEGKTPKMPAVMERAKLVSQHKPHTYTMLSDESDDDAHVAATHQVVSMVSTVLNVCFH